MMAMQVECSGFHLQFIAAARPTLHDAQRTDTKFQTKHFVRPHLELLRIVRSSRLT